MPPIRRLLTTSLLLLTVAACASTAGSTANGGAPRPSRNLLTQEEIRATNRQNAYEVVESLRSNWLRARGKSTLMGKDAEVLVYVDDSRAGGVEQLRAIPTSSISYIRWYDGISASGRWGLDHGAGVIYVSTRASGGGAP